MTAIGLKEVTGWNLKADPTKSGYVGEQLSGLKIVFGVDAPVLFDKQGGPWVVEWSYDAAHRLRDEFLPVLITSNEFTFEPDSGVSDVNITVIGKVRGEKSVRGLVLSVYSPGFEFRGTQKGYFSFKDDRGYAWSIFDPGDRTSWPDQSDFVHAMFLFVKEGAEPGQIIEPTVSHSIRTELLGHEVLLSIRETLLWLQSSKDGAETIASVPSQLVVVNCPFDWKEGIKDLPFGVSMIEWEDRGRASFAFMAPQTGVDVKVVAKSQTFTINGLGSASPKITGGELID
jgi:hypothetical protein